MEREFVLRLLPSDWCHFCPLVALPVSDCPSPQARTTLMATRS